MNAPNLFLSGCCTEWEQEICLYLDNELSPKGCERVKRHINRCGDCERFYRITNQEEQLLAGRLRHQTEFNYLQEAIANRVMDGIPVVQAPPLERRLFDFGKSVVMYFRDQHRRHYAFAASLIICVAGILMSMNVGEIPAGHSLTISRNNVGYRISLGSSFFVQNNAGEFIEFNDGSTIYAAPGTFFTVDSYPGDVKDESYVHPERRINLKMGELFIDVKKTNAGFNVVTSNSVVRVVGTQFYVGINSGLHKQTTVAVRQGQVIVEKKNRHQTWTFLEKHEMSRVISKNGSITMNRTTTIDPTIAKRLDLFNLALKDTSTWQLAPHDRILEDPSGSNTLPVDPFPQKNMIDLP